MTTGGESHTPHPLVESLRRVLAVAVFAAALAVTAAAWWAATTAENERARARFDRQLADIAQSAAAQVESYAALMRAARGLFLRPEGVSAAEWHRYVDLLNLPRRYPGLDSFGLAVPRAGGGADGIIISLLEPEPAYVALGYDLGTSVERRAAAEYARDIGTLATSGRLTLVTPGGTGSDLLLLLPVYRGGTAPDTVAERRTALDGWIIAGVRAGDMVAPIARQHPELMLEVFDGDVPRDDRRLYPGADAAERVVPPHPRLVATVELPVGGRTWLLRCRSTPAFEAQIGTGLPDLVLVTGGVLSALLWLTVHRLARLRGRAEAQARTAESARRLSEFRYQRFIEDSGEGFVEMDGDGRLADVNPAFCALLGQERGDLLGRRVADLFDGADWEDVKDQFRGDGQGERRHGEVTLRARDGSRVHVRVTASRWDDPDDGRAHFCALITDITTQKQQEEALRDQQERLQRIIAAIPVGMLVVRLSDGVVVQVNRGTAGLFGGRPADLLGRSAFDLFVEPDAGRQLAETVRHTGRADAVEARLSRLDGTPWWAVLSAARFLYGGEPTLLLGCQSIEALKTAQEGQRLAAAILNAVRDGVIVTDTERRILQVNPAFSWITGYEAEEVIGRSPALLASGRHGLSFYDAVWTTVSEHGYWQGDQWSRRKNGELFVSASSIVPIRDEAGRTTHFVEVIHDITSRKEDEERNWHLANYDGLTGLPNRLLFNDRLGEAARRAQRGGGRFALLYVDLDGFKAVNDRLGHPAGDRLLQEAARRLQACVRGTDTVARLGGDEFTIILADTPGREAARSVARKIIEALAASYRVDGAEATATASVGIALFPDDAGDAEGLVRAADTAMYHAKAAGKNRCAGLDDGAGALAGGGPEHEGGACSSPAA